MKALNDYFSVACFFITWLITHSIYKATVAGIIAMSAQVLIMLCMRKSITTLQWITLFVWIFFGGLTLFFHKPEFIQMKPTALYWLLAGGLLFNLLRKKQLLLKKMLGDKIQMRDAGWKRITTQWIWFLFLMGIANAAVAHFFSMSVWVNFKLFGTMGVTVVFAIMQSLSLNKFVLQPTDSEYVHPPKKSDETTK